MLSAPHLPARLAVHGSRACAAWEQGPCNCAARCTHARRAACRATRTGRPSTASSSTSTCQAARTRCWASSCGRTAAGRSRTGLAWRRRTSSGSWRVSRPAYQALSEAQPCRALTSCHTLLAASGASARSQRAGDGGHTGCVVLQAPGAWDRRPAALQLAECWTVPTPAVAVLLPAPVPRSQALTVLPAHAEGKLAPVPGLPQFVDWIKAKGIRRVAVSNAPKPNVEVLPDPHLHRPAWQPTASCEAGRWLAAQFPPVQAADLARLCGVHPAAASQQAAHA